MSLLASFFGRSSTTPEPSSPRNKSPRGTRPTNPGVAPLSLPDETTPLVVDTNPDSLGLSSPTAREIRARPIDIEKEIPLLFVDDATADGGGLTPRADEGGGCGPSSTSLPCGSGSRPASRQASAGFVGPGSLSLASALGADSPRAAMAASVGHDDIYIPVFEVLPEWEAFAASKRSRRPGGMIKYRHLPSHDKVAEYELDAEDMAWLAEFNKDEQPPLIDEDKLEDTMDALEKASFAVLHAPSQQRLMQPNASALPALTGAHAARSSGAGTASSSAPTGRRKEGRRSASGASPARSPKQAKQPKPDRPPPPSDAELVLLPAGLCRRYQQGRCHKGRSCKWKHEIWGELQARWDAWQNPGAAVATAAVCAPNTNVDPSGEPATEGEAGGLLVPKTEADPLGALALQELGVTSPLELVPPSLVPAAMAARAADVMAGASNGGAHGCAASSENGAATPEAGQSSGNGEALQLLDGEGSSERGANTNGAASSVGPSPTDDKSNGCVERTDDVRVSDAHLAPDEDPQASHPQQELRDPEPPGDDSTLAVDIVHASDDVEGDGGSRSPHGAVCDTGDGSERSMLHADDDTFDRETAVDGAGSSTAFDGPSSSSGVIVEHDVADDEIKAGDTADGAVSSDYGVPQAQLRDLFRGSGRIQQAVYDHWLGKRQRDRDQLPLLSRLRQEATQMRARQARLSTEHTDVLGLRTHLLRVRRLLALVKRREKLKAQIAALHQAHFEALVRHRKNGGAMPPGGSIPPTPHREAIAAASANATAAGINSRPPTASPAKRPSMVLVGRERPREPPAELEAESPEVAAIVAPAAFAGFDVPHTAGMSLEGPSDLGMGPALGSVVAESEAGGSANAGATASVDVSLSPDATAEAEAGDFEASGRRSARQGKGTE